MRSAPGWIAAALALGAFAAYAGWLLGHPVSIPSDDALFFVRSLERFSVLEFSPHFPGYPAFVLGARLLDLAVGDAATSVSLLGALAGLSIPAAVYLWIRAGGAAPAPALAAAACALLQPVLPALSLSMLSDPLGLALLLWHLVALRRGRFAAAGLLLGLAIAARPSYAVMAAASALCVVLRRPERAAAFGGAFAAVAAACAGFVLSADGLAYFGEGWRFVSGHFLIWGRGAADGSAPAWPAVLAALAGGYAALAVGAAALAWGARGIDRDDVAELCAAAMWASYALWMVLAQNPENPRHAAPLIFLGIALAGAGLARARPFPVSAAALGALLATAAYGFATSVDRSRAPSPLARASAALAERRGALVITQRGVEALRAVHPELRILDAHYEASARFAAHTAGDAAVLRLSGSALAPPWRRAAEFPRRFPGEAALGLYEWAAPGDPETAMARPAPASPE